MANYKVTLEFYYDGEEDISDWNTDVPFENVTSKEEAIELAKAELEANSVNDFTFKVEEV